MECCDATASSFGAKIWSFVFTNFHSTRLNCLASWDEFFVYNSLSVKENDEHALRLSHLFSELGDFGFFELED